jgi:hypothetical protein
MRVNARLDPESQRQLEYLRETTGAGVSDVLKASLEHYYAAVRGQHRPKLANLRPFIGTQGSGRSDVSERAKDLLGDALAAKAGSQRAGRARGES